MVKHPPTARRRLALWKSQVIDESVPMSTEGSSSGSVGAIAGNGQLSISFKPYDTIQFPKRTLSALRPGVFYMPMTLKTRGLRFFHSDRRSPIYIPVYDREFALNQRRLGGFLFAVTLPTDIARDRAR